MDLPEKTELESDAERIRKLWENGWQLAKFRVKGREYFKMRKSGEKDYYIGSPTPELDALYDEQSVRIPRITKGRAVTPEARAEAATLSVIGDAVAMEAKRATKEVLDLGLTLKNTKPVAQAYGFDDPAEFVQRLMVEKTSWTAPRKPSWGEFLDAAYTAVLARSFGIPVTHDFVMCLYLLYKLEGGD